LKIQKHNQSRKSNKTKPIKPPTYNTTPIPIQSNINKTKNNFATTKKKNVCTKIEKLIQKMDFGKIIETLKRTKASWVICIYKSRKK